MKGLIIALFFASSFPIVSLGKTAVRPVTPKPPVKPITVPGTAFKSAPLKAVGECGPACAEKAKSFLGRQEVKAINQANLTGKDAVAFGQLLEVVPALAASVQEQASVAKSSAIVSSFVAAGIQSSGWGDPVAQQNVVDTASKISVEGFMSNQKKANEVVENCRI